MVELHAEFLSLLRVVEGLQKKVNLLEQENLALIKGQKQMLEWVKQNQQDNECFQNNIEFELRDAFRQKADYFYPRIQEGSRAIEEIVTHRRSMARFGDGEFSVIAGRIRHSFQTQTDEVLRQRLLQVLQSDLENLLIGIADNYGALTKYSAQAKREIRCYLNPQVRREHQKLLNPDKLYYDAYVTRPYVMYEDHGTDAPKRRFADLKRIWENRNCVCVEGCFTRLGAGNDLLENAAGISRILGPAENAFSRYQDILASCMRQDKDTLFLLALGPAATVLAYDLCLAGFQAVDIGHIDLEYEWFLKGEGKRTPVPGKYNNEMMVQRQHLPEDSAYSNQIMEDFSGKAAL